MSDPTLPTGDYISPNLERVLPDSAFPNMIVGSPGTTSWPHLRRGISHNWYVDRRAPSVGFVSRDEASILYNTALMFDGLASLEIGCWLGWSTVHIALGTHSLDAMDPILAEPATREDVIETLRRAGVEDRVSLVPLASPEGVERLASETHRRWSFVFVDGDHTGDAPLSDAEVIHRFAASDALVILHDLAAPEPAAALAYLRDHGWTTAIYQTMQIMGVATRGRCRPVAHIPDPAQQWSLPEHLSSFTVIGESVGNTAKRIVMALGGSDRIADRQTEDEDAGGRADVEEALIAAARTIRELQETKSLLEESRHALGALQRFPDQVDHARLTSLLDRRVSASQTQSAEIARLHTKVKQRGQAIKRQGRDLLKLRVAVEAYGSREAVLRAVDAFAHAICKPRTLLGLTRRAMLGARNDVRRISAKTFKRHGSPIELPAPIVEWLSRPGTLIGLFRRRVLAGELAAEGVMIKVARASIRFDSSRLLSPKVAVTDLRNTLATADRRVKRRKLALLREWRRAQEAELKAQETEARLVAESRLTQEAEQKTQETAARLAAESRRTHEAEQKAQETDRKLEAIERALVAEEQAFNEAQLELATLRATRKTEAAGPDLPLEVSQ